MKEITGGYFTYCQFCLHDGDCALTHNEFMGQPSAGKIDKTGYPGHEDLSWHFSTFQSGQRASCFGRIRVTDSLFIPLVCECGTAISSFIWGQFCAKFEENEKGLERLKLAKEIARKKHIAIEETTPYLPPLDENYHAAMEQ